MSSAPKPVIVLVPGAWHSPYHYARLVTLLGAQGYEVLGDRYPTCGSRKPEAESVSGDADAIRGLVKPLVECGAEVVMLMHSYGGSPGSAAVVGLSKEDMAAQGKRGGVIGLIFMCAFVAAEGDSLLDKLPGKKLEPWHVVMDDGRRLGVSNPKEIFYHDVQAPFDQLAIDTLKPQAYTFVSTTSPAQAWHLPFYNGRRAYLKCTEDRAIPQVAQDAMVRYSGVEWDVGEVATGHSPFMVQPQEVVDFVVKQAEKFAAKA